MNIGAHAIAPVADAWPSDDELTWLAVRQPGVLRFLETRFPRDDDGLAVALATAWRVFAAYQDTEGIPAPRLERELLARAAYAVAREVAGPVTYEGIAVRQPDLCDFIYGVLQAPPIPLSRPQECLVATTMWAVIYALDEQVSGRPVP